MTKNILILLLSMVLVLPLCAQKDKKKGNSKGAVAPIEMKTFDDSISYALGLDIGNNIKKMGITLNADIIAQAIKDSGDSTKVRIKPAQNQALLSRFGQKMQEEQVKKAEAAKTENKTRGEVFLADNKKKPGVITLPSGLQYKVLKNGTGTESPKPTDQVVVHYHGTLINGKVFDSSYDRGEPLTLPANGVIQGWQEALQLMKVGDKWTLYIPYNLAYGEMGAGGGEIGPYETLVFDVELLEIKK